MKMRTKKDVSILMVALAIISFVVMPAYAQPDYCTEEGSLEPCPNCPKYQLWHIPANCDEQLDQGEVSAALSPFDWDATYGYCEQPLAGGGYLGYPGTQDIDVVNNKLIINICCCEDACEFQQGWVVGVELEILTSGVYWANDANVLDFASTANGLDPEATTCYQGDYSLMFSRWNKGTGSSLHTQPCSQDTQRDANVTNDGTFKISYYNASRTWVNGPSLNNYAKIIRTPTPYDGYEITATDVTNNLCDFWIDVPAMQIAANQVPASGTTVQVQAKLLVAPPYTNAFTDGGVDPDCDDAATLGNLSYLRPAGDPGIGIDPPLCQTVAGGQTGTGWTECADPAGDLTLADCGCAWTWPASFCPECESPCSCTKDVGIVCCEPEELEISNCIYFPYVIVDGMDDNGYGWATGVGLTKICGASTGTIDFTLTDCEGGVFTGSTTISNCYVNMIDEIALTGDGEPAPGAAWLRVQATDVMIDGYQFLYQITDNGMFGAGTLPRLGCPCN